VQIVYERLLRMPEAVSKAQNPKAYIFEVARKVQSTAHRRRSGEPISYVDIESGECANELELQCTLWGDASDQNIDPVLFKAAFLEVLSPELQHIFELRYRGHTVEAIAEIAKSSPNTVKKQIARARVLLKKRLALAAPQSPPP
jgi:RNA polymerase sigma factor (sigma-70 family)